MNSARLVYGVVAAVVVLHFGEYVQNGGLQFCFEKCVVGPAGFEPTTFPRKQCLGAAPTGFSNRSRTSSSLFEVRKPVSYFLEPVVIPA